MPGACRATHPAYPVYLLMSGAGAVLRNTMYVTWAVYLVVAIHMNALQLVLTGTVLEVSYFVFQMPTGVIADVYSRRGAVVLGWCINGFSFLITGAVHNVVVILAAQALLGLGEALVSGAEEAWLADEVGQEQFAHFLVRGSQVGQAAALVGIVLSVTLASVRLDLPLLVGGGGMMLVGVALACTMCEDGFTPHPRGQQIPWRHMSGTLRSGARLVRRNPVLLTILGVAVFAGAGSEGFDRLWEAHLIRDIHLPPFGTFKPLVWFAAIAGLSALVSFLSTSAFRPSITRLSHRPALMAQWLLVANLLLVTATVGFAVAGNLVLALAALMLRAAIGAPAGVLRAIWLNAEITDSSVRATVLSMDGQADALGQWIGGPVVGVLGVAVSLPAAIAATGLIRLPISLLYASLGRRSAIVAPSVEVGTL